MVLCWWLYWSGSELQYVIVIGNNDYVQVFAGVNGMPY